MLYLWSSLNFSSYLVHVLDCVPTPSFVNRFFFRFVFRWIGRFPRLFRGMFRYISFCYVEQGANPLLLPPFFILPWEGHWQLLSYAIQQLPEAEFTFSIETRNINRFVLDYGSLWKGPYLLFRQYGKDRKLKFILKVYNKQDSNGIILNYVLNASEFYVINNSSKRA